MVSIIKQPKAELSPYAPRVESISINPDKIREVIGKGGETIQRIVAETGAQIDIKDDGTIMIASPDGKSIEAAREQIQQIVAEPEVGKIYVDAPVVSVLDFGAFRSEEHTSELQSLMRISYAVFCLKKKK